MYLHSKERNSTRERRVPQHYKNSHLTNNISNKYQRSTLHYRQKHSTEPKDSLNRQTVFIHIFKAFFF